MRLILDGVEFDCNIGSLVRSAVAFGVTEIVFVGETTHRYMTSARIIKQIKKSSVGAIRHMPIKFYETAQEYLESRNGGRIIAIENTNNAEPLRAASFYPSDDLVLGNEARGVSAEILDACHAVYKIEQTLWPIRCLNVAIAGSIALYWCHSQLLAESKPAFDKIICFEDNVVGR